MLSVAYQDPGAARLDLAEPLPEWVVDDRQHVAVVYKLPQLNVEAEYAAHAGAHPPGPAGQQRAAGRIASLSNHFLRRKNSQDPAGSDLNGMRVKTECLPSFEQENACARLGRSLAQRAISKPRMNCHGRTKGFGQGKSGRVVEVGTDLRQVDPMVRTSVEVDSEAAELDYLPHQQVGQL